jgi:hypothetical protein
MNIRYVLALCVTAALVGSTPQVLAQAPPKVDKKEQEKRSKQQREDVAALVKLVDAVSAGEPAASATDQQSELAIKWESNHFLKAQDGSTYVPFTLSVGSADASASTAALYVRAVAKTPAAAPTENDKKSNEKRPAYPWDNSYVIKELRPDVKVQRAMQLAGGDYDLFVAVREQSNDKKKPGKTGLLRRTLTVPDFKASELTTSSIMIGTIEPIAAPLSAEEQQENPYTLGTMKIVPMADPKLSKTGELSLIFWIYGTGSDPATMKPNTTVEYSFYQKTGDTEKYFNKTAPQELNAQTLPPQFDPAAGHQLPGSLAVPLTSFPAGDYRLEIKVTDKPTGKTLVRNVNFTVNAT